MLMPMNDNSSEAGALTKATTKAAQPQKIPIPKQPSCQVAIPRFSFSPPAHLTQPPNAGANRCAFNLADEELANGASGSATC